MAKYADVRTQEYSSPESKVYDPSGGDVDLVTDRPGYADGMDPRLAARALYFPVAGIIGYRLNDAASLASCTLVTLTVTAGTYLPVQTVGLESSVSTVTECLVMW